MADPSIKLMFCQFKRERQATESENPATQEIFLFFGMSWSLFYTTSDPYNIRKCNDLHH